MFAGEGRPSGDQIHRCAFEDDAATLVARAGVDDPVGVCHDSLVVLDDNDRLAGVDEPAPQADPLLDFDIPESSPSALTRSSTLRVETPRK
jgi:hypothetical protein